MKTTITKNLELLIYIYTLHLLELHINAKIYNIEVIQ